MGGGLISLARGYECHCRAARARRYAHDGETPRASIAELRRRNDPREFPDAGHRAEGQRAECGREPVAGIADPAQFTWLTDGGSARKAAILVGGVVSAALAGDYDDGIEAFMRATRDSRSS